MSIRKVEPGLMALFINIFIWLSISAGWFFFCDATYINIYWASACVISFVVGMVIGIGYTVTAPDDAYYNGTYISHPHLWLNMVMTHLGTMITSTSGLILLIWFIYIAIREECY